MSYKRIGLCCSVELPLRWSRATCAELQILWEDTEPSSMTGSMCSERGSIALYWRLGDWWVVSAVLPHRVSGDREPCRRAAETAQPLTFRQRTQLLVMRGGLQGVCYLPVGDNTRWLTSAEGV
jgi:hypothetical protein